jgi:RNA polymerase sigma factor (sigma-70 family)
MRFLRSKKTFSQDDASLIDEYRRTAEPALIGILFDRYSHLLFAVSMNYLKNEDDSKDVVLHIFEKLPADIKKYEIRNFGSWIYSITKNYCLKLLREKKYNLHLNESLTPFEPDEEDPDSALTDKMLSHLGEAVFSLNEPQQKCIKLFYFEEKSYKEIELITGYNYEKVKSHIQNGKRNMKIFLLNKK